MSVSFFSFNNRVFNNISMESNQISDVIDIAEVGGYSVHAYWTGTPAGNIEVQGSNDGSNFVTVDTTAAGGVVGSRLFNVEKCHYRYVRIKYTFSSSIGTLNCYVSGKRV